MLLVKMLFGSKKQTETGILLTAVLGVELGCVDSVCCDAVSSEHRGVKM